MSIEENKATARAFFDHFSAGDVAGALAIMADDATWWIAGKPDQQPAAGTYSKAKIARLFDNMGGQLPNGLKMTVKSLIAEDDRVALEVESLGELSNGRVYNQEYHFLLTLRDGKISGVREYLDTQHVFATWFQP
ncbi:MAG TPA: nuclear transport factor 2 family protein [Blastocatellia bacterium]|nr:nuclear transport factor 2 family protein [Blastocatellia bacterium]